jgi:hypothetical protein
VQTGRAAGMTIVLPHVKSVVCEVCAMKVLEFQSKVQSVMGEHPGVCTGKARNYAASMG